MKLNKYILVAFSFLLIFLGAFHSNVSAQLVTLSLTPPLIQTIIKPGKSILIAYTFQNLDDPAVINTRVMPFEPKDNNGNIHIKDRFEGPIRFSLDNSILQLDQPFFMKTKDIQQLLLRIRVPDGAPAGDYYYTLLAESQPPTTQEGSATSRAKVTIGSNILITISETGNLDVKGRISRFAVLPRFSVNFLGNNLSFFDSSDVIPLSFVIHNDGNNLIVPNAQISLRGNFGEEATYDAIPKNILAHSDRLINATPSATLNCDDSQNASLCQKPVSLLIKGFFVGIYKLSTTVDFGEGSPNIYANTSFVALPLRLIGALFVVFVISVIIIIRVRKGKKVDNNPLQNNEE